MKYTFDKWYEVEGESLLDALAEYEYEPYDCTDLDKLAKRAAQLAWNAAIQADLS